MEMKKYTRVKEILATPMNLKDYNDYRGWELPADEDGGKDGFLVEYAQSETSPNQNHPAHAGYISWSPKDVFDKSCISTDVELNNTKTFDQLEPHQQRVMNELKDLTKKSFDLSNFIETDFFKSNISADEQTRLKQQLIVMNTYQSILIQRVNNF